jgi:outer membrane receptor for ferrienterochelin and colicin
MSRRLLTLAGALLWIASPAAFSQTNPTGTISGKVVDQQGLAIPGAVVSVHSPALQGTRAATTTVNGDYIIPFLPPGDYTVTIEMSGFSTVKQAVRVTIDATVTVDASMALSAVTETVEVTGVSTADFGQKAAVATNFKQELIEKLPLARNFQAAAALTPGVESSGPQGNLVISGAPSFQNLYMINGVVVQDNIRSTPFNLFIEDALQETTTTIASVSAEYGRFGGGVVSAITKSGGNSFSGSFRTTFENDDWRSLTPFPNDKRTDDVIPTYEATLGGPILRDKLWFFGAARLRDFKETRTTGFTSLNYDRELNEKRYEGKLTFSPTTEHTFRGAYTWIDNSENGNSFGTIMDFKSLVNRTLPQKLLSLNYTGILKPNFFVELQYSSRKFTFEGSGSLFTDLIQGTLLLDRSRGNARYNSPTFCGVCEDETRDNNNVIVKGSYFLSTQGSGSHSLVFGVDAFDDKRFSNNHQSGSDYRIFTTSAILQGENVMPVLEPVTTFIRWTPIFESSQGNRFRTWSVFFNDAWTLNKNFSFNLGVRWDKNDGKDASGNAVVKDSAFSPRLSATWDPKGDGTWTANASYAQYVTAIANGVADSQSVGGQPATIDFDYLGPAVNTGNPANPVPTDQALQILWDWFNANGGTNRPTRGAPDIPGVTTQIKDTLASPNVKEFVLGVSRRLGTRGLVRLDGVFRTYGDFYAQRRDLSTGKVTDDQGNVFDLAIIENAAEGDLERKYKALNFQLSYKAFEDLTLGGNYSLAETTGNVDAETGPSGPVSAGIYDFPEYFDSAWTYPIGNLLTDVRHRVRAWAIWTVPVPDALGRFDLSSIYYYNSGTPYGSAGAVNTRPYVTNPGYENPPATRTYYFEPRDTYRMEDLHRVDLALNWSRRIGVKNAEIFFRGRVLNVFDADALTNFTDGLCGTGGCINTTINTNNNVASLARFNPFSETPVQGVNWTKGTSFGQATNRGAYQTPRTYDFSVGFRF